MKFTKTSLDGVYLIEPEPKEDDRGYFARTFCKGELSANGVEFDIKQINHSLTLKKGSIRGMHFQREPCAEAKIVQCLAGEVYDVAVDLRPNSPTFYKWVSVRLTRENGKMLYIPKGFAHGFQTLSDKCLMQYLMSEFYSPESSSGVRWNDPALKIKWLIAKPTNISEKDEEWPLIEKS